MAKISSLVAALQSKYSQFSFVEAERDKWSHEHRTIYYNPQQPRAEAYLLHELAHGLLDHKEYKKDIHLLQIERDAWHYAKEKLAPNYSIVISEELVDEALDTYRDWIHTKSSCPRCEASGLEILPQEYFCICCSWRWHVNRGIDTHIMRYSHQ